MADVLIELVRSADWAQGVVFVNGHGGNATAMSTRRRRARPRGATRPRVVAARAGRRSTRRSRRDVVDAGAWRPTRCGSTAPSPDRCRRWPNSCASACSRSSPSGVLGDPTRATAEARPAAASTSSPSNSSSPSPSGSTGLDSDRRRRRGRYAVPARSQRATVRTGDRRRLAAEAVPRHRRRRGSRRSHRRRRGGARSRRSSTALRRGGRDPSRSPTRSPFAADDVTIVVPTFGVAAPRARRARCSSTTDRPVRLPGATLRLDRNRGPGAARNAGLALVPTPLVAFVDTDVELADGLARSTARAFRRPRVGARRPARARRPATPSPVDLVRARQQPARPRPRAGPHPRRHAASATCRRRRSCAVSTRSARSADSTSRSASARTSTSCGVSTRPAGAAGTSRRARCATTRARRGARGCASGSRTARRRRRSHVVIRGALAPIRMSGWSVATWALAAIGTADRRIGGRRRVGGGADPQAARRPAAGRVRARRRAATSTPATRSPTAIRRVWWPLVAVAALRSRTARRDPARGRARIPPPGAARRRRRLLDRRLARHGRRAHVRAARPRDQFVARAPPGGATVATRQRNPQHAR